MRLSKIHLFLVFYISSGLFCISCEPEAQHPVPEFDVNFRINVFSDPEFFRLRTPGNSVVITSTTFGHSIGYDNNGIIIYSGGDGEYYAFDRTCPHDIPLSIAVESNPTSGLATCPECGSVYVFPSMGAPSLDSPSKWPLLEYHAYYNPNTGDITVTN